jgi:ABC-type phosphate/phosphonate transport system substrate-binding protein
MNLASLPMYDLAGLARATDAWWGGLAQHMRREGIIDVPEILVRPDQLEAHWLSPGLLFSQTCGYPLTHHLRGRVQLVGLPVYAAEGCHPDGFYSSAIVVPAASNIHALADCRQRRAVYNTPDSMSGLLALRLAAKAESERLGLESGKPFFGSLNPSGAHIRSLEAVAGGEAEVATIDAVTMALIRQSRPELASAVRVLGYSPRVPGLPYITSLRTPPATVARLRMALRHAMSDPDLAPVRAELLLTGICFPEPASYDLILELENEASDWPLA